MRVAFCEFNLSQETYSSGESKHRLQWPRVEETRDLRHVKRMRTRHSERQPGGAVFQILQRHFTAWYDVVLEQRLRMGKARAMCEWRRLVRAWNAWRRYVRDKRLDRDAQRHQRDVIDTQRSESLVL